MLFRHSLAPQWATGLFITPPRAFATAGARSAR
jgi:hypothetical protein